MGFPKSQILLIFLVVLYLQSGLGCNRVPGSPYLCSKFPPSEVFLVNDSSLSSVDQLTYQTFQGVLARTQPRTMRFRPGQDNWLIDNLQQNSQQLNISLNSTFQNDYFQLLHLFRTEFDGYALYNINDVNQINAVISLCSAVNVIAVNISQEETIKKATSLPLYLNLAELNWTVNDVYENFPSNFSTCGFSFQEPSMYEYLADYAVFGRMITDYGEPANENVSAMLATQLPNCPVFGWSSENIFVGNMSERGLFVHASDWAMGLSFLTNLDEANLNQNTETLAEYNVPKTEQTEEKIEKSDNISQTICFLVSDGDNIQWLLNGFATSPNAFGSTYRGIVPIGWTLSSALSELAPSVMRYFYNNASKNSETGALMDLFVDAPSGLGYTYPDLFPSADFPTFVNLSATFNNKADLQGLVNVIGNPIVPLTEDMDVYLSNPAFRAVFYYNYNHYFASYDQFPPYFVNQKDGLRKLVMGSRYYLWEGCDPTLGNNCEDDGEPVVSYNPQTLAQVLEQSAADQSTFGGYSLVAVNVWNYGPEDVVNTVNLLKSSSLNYRIVDPVTFVDLITKNVKT